MGSPAFNPNAAYSVPAFDPNGSFQAAPVATATAPAEKSLLQRAQDKFDALTTVTPEQQAGHSAAFNAVQNFGAHVIHGVGGAIVHPMDTLSGIGSTIAHPIDTAVALGHSAMSDPVGTAGELVGGALLGEAGAAGVGAINKTASASLGRAALLGKTPEEAYEAALKPPPVSVSATERANAVRAGLENSVPVSKSGVEIIADRLDKLNQAVADTVAKDPNRPIDPNKVAARTNNSLTKFSNQVNPESDVAAIQSAREEFLRRQGAKLGSPATPPQPTGLLDAQGNPIMTQGTPATPPTPAPDMSALEAQKMKQGTYRVLSGKFGEQGSAAVEAQKDLARGLKEEVANQFPELNDLNGQESRLLDLQPLIERAVNKATNQGLFRLGTAAVAGTFKALTGSEKVAATAAVLKQVLDDPMIKSRLAIAVSKGGKIPYVEAASRIGAYSSALGSTAQAPQGYSSADNPNRSTSGQP